MIGSGNCLLSVLPLLNCAPSSYDGIIQGLLGPPSLLRQMFRVPGPSVSLLQLGDRVYCMAFPGALGTNVYSLSIVEYIYVGRKSSSV